MADEDREKTAFCCSSRGLFEFNVMPFGLINAPSIFSQLISVALQGLEDFTVAYLDDILIYSEDLSSHMKHIQEVFDRLRLHQFEVEIKEMQFSEARDEISRVCYYKKWCTS